MIDLENEYRLLIRDTLQWIQENQQIVFADPEAIHFFQGLSPLVNKEIKTKPTPVFVKKPIVEETKRNLQPIKENPIEKKEEVKKPSFSIYETLKEKMETRLPSLKTVEKIPSFHKPITLHCEIVLLSTEKDAEEELFLNNLIQAISQHLTPAQKISIQTLEKENIKEVPRDTLKLFIASYDVFSSSYFLSSLKHLPQENRYYFLDIPLIALEPFHNYVNAFVKKKQLWNLLCQMFKSRFLPPS